MAIYGWRIMRFKPINLDIASVKPGSIFEFYVRQTRESEDAKTQATIVLETRYCTSYRVEFDTLLGEQQTLLVYDRSLGIGEWYFILSGSSAGIHLIDMKAIYGPDGELLPFEWVL